MNVMQNKIHRLLPMILCLIMALAIVTGMGNFALAGEIPGEKTFDNTKNTARAAIEEAITAGTANSATVAIMDGGELIYAAGFGMADREKNIAVNEDTVFNIGSVSRLLWTIR